MKSETFEKIIANLNGGMAAKMFGMIGFKPNYTLEQLQEIEQEFQAMYGGREILPTTVVPFGFYLGETLVRNIPNAKWDFTADFLCDVSIKIQGKDGGELIAKPFTRFEKFLKDDSDKPSTMFWLFSQLSQKTTKELMAEGTPLTDGWYKFPDGHMFRFFIEKKQKVRPDT